MERNVYLEGELGQRYGQSMTIHAENVKEVFRLLDVNNPNFKEYLIDCVDKNIGFAIDVAGNELEYESELLLPLKTGDITITAIPEGSGGGFKKVLLAAAIIAFAWYAPMIGSTAIGSGTVGGTTTFMTSGLIAGGGMAQLTLYLVGINIAMMGIQEMMAPDPATDNDQESSYLFNGLEQNLLEGDPVPVLYGRLQVPGQPVNFEVTNSRNHLLSDLRWQGSLFGGKPQLTQKYV